MESLEKAVRGSVLIYHSNDSVIETMKRVLGDEYDVDSNVVNRNTNPQKVAQGIVNEKPDLVYIVGNFSTVLRGQGSEPEGIEVLKEVKNRDPDIPIVLMSSGNTNLDRNKARNHGAADHLSMPYSVDELKKLTRIRTSNFITLDDIETTTPRQFRAMFSTHEPGTSLLTYEAPNEHRFAETFQQLHRFLGKVREGNPNPRVGFYGIVGGVDLSLSYIAAIWNKLGVLPSKSEAPILTDINEAALDYAMSRTGFFGNTQSVEDYWTTLRIGGLKATDAVMDYVHSKFMREEDREHLWFKNGSFDLLKGIVRSSGIKTFQSDYYEKGQERISKMIEAQRPGAVVMYLSDIATTRNNRLNVTSKDGIGRNQRVLDTIQKLDIPILIIESGLGEGGIGTNYVSVMGEKAA